MIAFPLEVHLSKPGAGDGAGAGAWQSFYLATLLALLASVPIGGGRGYVRQG
jgi:hypothetical protein